MQNARQKYMCLVTEMYLLMLIISHVTVVFLRVFHVSFLIDLYVVSDILLKLNVMEG